MSRYLFSNEKTPFKYNDQRKVDEQTNNYLKNEPTILSPISLISRYYLFMLIFIANKPSFYIE